MLIVTSLNWFNKKIFPDREIFPKSEYLWRHLLIVSKLISPSTCIPATRNETFPVSVSVFKKPPEPFLSSCHRKTLKL